MDERRIVVQQEKTTATALRTRAVPAPPPRVGTYSGCGGGGSSAGRWRCRHPWVRTRTPDWPPAPVSRWKKVTRKPVPVSFRINC
ncbi:Hypothetical predicted protein [Marmota monax]|uniref:Uncharacterized protein n=1 Tax=Marmota monax TaxID=9995 RepID=A0A5E4AHH8_MARMO|nr:hypothetical protein GHT09_016570 [Marmota monax]VTJ56837.1 Hypothetical predicted protein [Marmota monax]